MVLRILLGRAAPHPPTTPWWVMTDGEDGGTLPHGVTLVLFPGHLGLYTLCSRQR